MLGNRNCALPGVEDKGYRGRWLFLFCVMSEWAMNVGFEPAVPLGAGLLRAEAYAGSVLALLARLFLFARTQKAA